MLTQEKELIMRRAAHHANLGEFDLALSSIQGILDFDPDDAIAWFNKGYTLHLAGKTDEAWDLFIHLHEQYPDKSDVCFELGLLSAAKKDYDKAEYFFSKCILLQPLNPDPRIECAKMWYEAGYYHKAQDRFTEALVFDPENSQIRSYLGQVAYHLKKPDEAERWFLESLEYDPVNTEALYHCARIYEEQDRKDDEIRCYERLIEIDPEQIVPWLKKGMISLVQDNLSMAASSFRMASYLDSDSHLPFLLLGLVYNTMDLHEDAIKALQKAISMHSEPEILHHYGRVLGSSSQYDEALEVFFQLLQDNPEDTVAAEGYARSLYHLNRWDELATFCYEQKNIEPDNPFWITTLARVLGWHLSDTDTAKELLLSYTNDYPGVSASLVLVDLLVYIEDYEKAYNILSDLNYQNPEEHQVLFRLSSLLAQMKEFKSAAEEFEKLIQLKPHDYYLAYLAGQANEQAGELERALELYTKALEGMPGKPEIWLSRARVLLDLGHGFEAAVNAAQATELQPDNYDAVLFRGIAETQCEEYEKARVSLTCATLLEPDNPEGWGYLGDVLLMSGEDSAAKICYERALQLDPSDKRALGGCQACKENE